MYTDNSYFVVPRHIYECTTSPLISVCMEKLWMVTCGANGDSCGGQLRLVEQRSLKLSATEKTPHSWQPPPRRKSNRGPCRSGHLILAMVFAWKRQLPDLCIWLNSPAWLQPGALLRQVNFYREEGQSVSYNWLHNDVVTHSRIAQTLIVCIGTQHITGTQPCKEKSEKCAKAATLWNSARHTYSKAQLSWEWDQNQCPSCRE